MRRLYISESNIEQHKPLDLYEDFNVSLPMWVRKLSRNVQADWLNGTWTQLEVTPDNVVAFKDGNALRDDENKRYFARGVDDANIPFVLDSWNIDNRVLQIGQKNSRVGRASAKWLSNHIDEMGVFEQDTVGYRNLRAQRAQSREGDYVSSAQHTKQHKVKDYNYRTGDYEDKWITGPRSSSWNDDRYDKSGYRKPDIRAKYRDMLYELSLGRYASTVDKLCKVYEDLCACFRYMNKIGPSYDSSNDKNRYGAIRNRIENILISIETAKAEVDQYSMDSDKKELIRRIKEAPKLIEEAQAFIDEIASRRSQK